MRSASRGRSKIGISFSVLCFFCTPLWTTLVNAQASSQTPPSSTIEKNVDEVSLDLVVHNKKNRPILDLKPDDITVTDDGHPEQISSLSLVSSKDAGGDHLVTLLFDRLDPSAESNARSIAEKILKMIPDSGFQLSVMDANQRLRLFQAFTANRQALRDAVATVTDESDAQRNAAAVAAEKGLTALLQAGVSGPESAFTNRQRNLQKTVLASIEEYREITQEQNCHPALCGLLALSRAQTRLRGQKVIVYFTQGLQLDSNTQDALRSIILAANRGGVRIYPINASGIDPREFSKLTQTVAIGNAMTANRLNPQPTAAGLTTSEAVDAAWISKAMDTQLDRFETDGMAGFKDPLGALAAGTGGRYVASDESFKKPIRQMIADLSTYYQLSYVPHLQQYDRKFHSVVVKPVRKGIMVSSGPGYFALPPSEASGTWAFEVPLLKILAEAKLPSDLQVHTRVLQMGPLPDGATDALVIEVPFSEIATRADTNTDLLSWHVSIVAQIKNKAGVVVEHYSEDAPGRRALNAKDQAQLGGVTIQRHFVLPPGEYSVEAAVMDRLSGKVGATRTNLEIAGIPAGPFLSDVVRVRQLHPSSEEIDPFNPFRYRDSTVLPTISDQVPPGSKDISLFFLVRSDPSIAQAAVLEMQISRNGELLAETPLQLPSESAGEAMPYIASIGSASLPPGNYQVVETLTQGDKVAERGTRFRISGTEPASNVANLATESPNQQDAIETVADSSFTAATLPPPVQPHLQITSLPPGSALHPSPADLDTIIAGARAYALKYSAKLPNFLCVELTDRSEDPSGKGRWRHRDSFAELLRFRDKQETRTTLEMNGQKSSIQRADMQGPISLGEFGDLLNAIFQPSAKAGFQWKETDALSNNTLQVFEYKVDRRNASMTLTDSDRRVYAGFHGLVYIDSSTLGVRRVTMEADGLPADFSIHAASIAVEYDYVAIGTHDYLMPVRGTIRLRRGRREADLNQVVFQDYKRYGAQAKISLAP